MDDHPTTPGFLYYPGPWVQEAIGSLGKELNSTKVIVVGSEYSKKINRRLF
ncbi:MAG: hypothetical protein JMM74_01010 [Candidatus Xiphinematobacter sp.]|nr:MAG: hypothetical protein JMM74_01010 [Candidatus Xiphinematobacter sp.]